MPDVKLGKLAPVFDRRTLRASSIMKSVTLPDRYSVDGTLPAGAVPTPMFANDVNGCCVISARAHHTLRLMLQHGALPQITDEDVVRQYYLETGGEDAGLVMLHSLKSWRSDGWLAAGVQDRIAAFTSIRPKVIDEIKTAIYTMDGVHFGIELPLKASEQFDTGEPWENVDVPGKPWYSQPGGWGGHAILAYAWEPGWFECITWGKRQRMSYEWIERYASEAYAVIDSAEVPERAEQRRGINMVAVGEYLERVGGL